MKPRRILIVTNRVPYPLKDGGNMAMHAMIESYHKTGWKVYLLSMNTKRHKVSEEHLARLYTNLEGFKTVDVDNSIGAWSVIKNYLFSKTPNHVERFFHHSFADKLEEVIKDFDPEIIQVESVFLTTYMSYIRHNTDALTVLRMHNVEYHVWRSLAHRSSQWYKKLYLKNLQARMKKYEMSAWRKYDMLLPITEKDAETVKQMAIRTYTVIAPFGIDVNKIKAGINERWDGYHIGAMDWRPNQFAIKWFLRRVWPKVHKAVPDFNFYFAGRNMPASLRKLTIDGVHCMGEVPDAAEFISDKKILIVPIRSGGGIRVKILEAMAAGKVVISTATGMKGIDAMPRVHYILASKSDSFVLGIKWCIENTDSAQKMADNALAFIKTKYDQDAIMKNVMNEMETLLSVKRI